MGLFGFFPGGGRDDAGGGTASPPPPSRSDDMAIYFGLARSAELLFVN